MDEPQVESHPVLVTNGQYGRISLRIGESWRVVEFSDHFTLVRQLISLCGSCLCVSPFLYRDFHAFFTGIQLSSVDFELISSHAVRGTDQLEKPFALRSFGECVMESSGKWPEIGLNESLHSKIYVFSRNQTPFAGIVTSANLTDAGLKRNHETGLVVTEESRLRLLIDVGKMGLEFVSLAPHQIDRLCNAADFIERRDGRGAVDINVGLKSILNTYGTPSAGNRNAVLSGNASYFIKVSGTKEYPILAANREPMVQPHCKLDFAKSPDRIRIGDCLLEVAVGEMCFLPYYACASAPYERSDQEKTENQDYKRWPYFVYANNMALHYGAAWFDAPLLYDAVVEEFRERYPSVSVTTAGSFHLRGAIQMGNSYFQVTKEFGQFVRQKIDAFAVPGVR